MSAKSRHSFPSKLSKNLVGLQVCNCKGELSVSWRMTVRRGRIVNSPGNAGNAVVVTERTSDKRQIFPVGQVSILS